MSPVPTHPEETWQAWTRRVADELAGLGDGRWSTFAVHVPADARDRPRGDDRATPGRRRGRFGRRRAGRAVPTGPAAPPDVFLQASLVDGLLALECIVDPEFEGVSTLDEALTSALRQLGWEPAEGEADLALVLVPDAGGAAAATAADLLTRTLRDVLGATAPSAVDRRHG